MTEAASKKQRDMTVQIFSKFGVDQSVSRGNERYTQRLMSCSTINNYLHPGGCLPGRGGPKS